VSGLEMPNLILLFRSNFFHVKKVLVWLVFTTNFSSYHKSRLSFE
jgi:hypothetical protein